MGHSGPMALPHTFDDFMGDHCTIWPPPTARTTNPDFTVDYTIGVAVYDGCCQLDQRRGRQVRVEGGADVVLDEVDLYLPPHTTGITPGCMVQVQGGPELLVVDVADTTDALLTAVVCQGRNTRVLAP